MKTLTLSDPLKSNASEYRSILSQYGITKLYHFTDRDNLQSIIENGGLYSWADCDSNNISIAKPGGGSTSRSLDMRDGLQNYVRVSFTCEHPMMYVAMNDSRISNPIILEIDPMVIELEETLYADRNATKNGANIGGNISDFKKIHFDSVKAKKHFDLPSDEQEFFQAEILVKNSIPLKYITNIANFGIPIPSQPSVIQTKPAYTAQITRSTPTAFIFLIDQSISMGNTTTLMGENMTLAEAVARIVNRQINDLVLRCIKATEIRHYYDIAIIGYGDSVYCGWNGDLGKNYFASPEQIKDNPYKTIKVREEIITRKGTSIKEIEKDQWLEARHDGRCTHLHKAFDKAKELLSDWMNKYHDKDCYPPTIINITDGEYNGTTKENILQLANELKSMHTNDGNVILFNIHVTPNSGATISFPTSKNEVSGYSTTLYELSSLLPLRYNPEISKIRHDSDQTARHTAMSVNADMSTLIQLMDVGTPTNINQNK